ncbi:MAG: hypothetical protein AAGD40_09775, partial [Pseudomonadota bacterium]
TALALFAAVAAMPVSAQVVQRGGAAAQGTGDPPIIVMAARTDAAPPSATILDAQEIARVPAPSLTDVLTRVPGVRAFRIGGSPVPCAAAPPRWTTWALTGMAATAAKSARAVEGPAARIFIPFEVALSYVNAHIPQSPME